MQTTQSECKPFPVAISSVPETPPEPKDAGEEIPQVVAHPQQWEGKWWRTQSQFASQVNTKQGQCLWRYRCVRTTLTENNFFLKSTHTKYTLPAWSHSLLFHHSMSLSKILLQLSCFSSFMRRQSRRVWGGSWNWEKFGKNTYHLD